MAQGPDGETGRRKGLKIPRPQGHVGSIPTPGTNADDAPGLGAYSLSQVTQSAIENDGPGEKRALYCTANVVEQLADAAEVNTSLAPGSHASVRLP